jgi:hypothetical protein
LQGEIGKIHTENDTSYTVYTFSIHAESPAKLWRSGERGKNLRVSYLSTPFSRPTEKFSRQNL